MLQIPHLEKDLCCNLLLLEVAGGEDWVMGFASVTVGEESRADLKKQEEQNGLN